MGGWGREGIRQEEGRSVLRTNSLGPSCFEHTRPQRPGLKTFEVGPNSFQIGKERARSDDLRRLKNRLMVRHQ